METFVIRADPFKAKRFDINDELHRRLAQQKIDQLKQEEQGLKRNKNKKGGKFYPKKKKSR